MKNAKKLLVLLVVFAMLLSLCACGAQQKQPEEKSAASAAEGAASAERTRIEVWHRASADMGANVLEEAAAEFNASQDSFEIVPVYNSGEYKGLIQQMVADAASGSTPGICQISYTWSEATGYLPGRADVRESDGFKAYVEEHPYLNAGLNVIDALNTPVAFPGSSALQLQDDFCNARDAIYTGHGTALDVMTALAESANQLMNEG